MIKRLEADRFTHQGLAHEDFVALPSDMTFVADLAQDEIVGIDEFGQSIRIGSWRRPIDR